MEKMAQDLSGKDVMPEANNAMCAIMWVLFRDLYTFMPGMYNHIMELMNERLSKCENGIMLGMGSRSTDDLANGLHPRYDPIALSELNKLLYVSTDGTPIDPNDDRDYLLEMNPQLPKECKVNKKHMWDLIWDNFSAASTFIEDERIEKTPVVTMSWVEYCARKHMEKFLKRVDII